MKQEPTNQEPMIRRVPPGVSAPGSPLASDNGNGNGAKMVLNEATVTANSAAAQVDFEMPNPMLSLIMYFQSEIEKTTAAAISGLKAAIGTTLEEAPQQILDALGIDPRAIIDNLVGLPSAINSTAKQIASLRSDMHKREDDLKALEIPLLYAANEQGKNVEQRKLLFDEACAKDAGIIEKRKVISALDQQIKGLEADRDMFMEQSRNYRAVSRMLCSYIDRSPVSNGAGE